MDLKTVRRRLVGFRIIIFLALTAIAVIIVLLSIGQMEQRVYANAVVYPKHRSKVYSPMNGILQGMFFREGDVVREGDVLAKLNDETLRDQLAAKQEELERAQIELKARMAELKLAESNPLPKDFLLAQTELERARKVYEVAVHDAERVRKLVEKGILPRAELEKAQLQVDLAQSACKSAELKLQVVKAGLKENTISAASIRVDLAKKKVDAIKREVQRIQEAIERTVIRAPASGQIIYAPKREGESVTGGELVFIIAEGTDAELRAYVPEDRIFRVSVGQKVRIYSSVFSYRKYGISEGVVRRVAEYPDDRNGRHAYEVVIDVTETPLPLKFGSTASAAIVVDRCRILDMLLGGR